MPISLADALKLLPSTLRDTRSDNFIKIVFWMCAEADQINPLEIPPSLIPYKLDQYGLGQIAGLASRLPLASQRVLLGEASELVRLAGTPRSIKRVLELFGYPNAVIEENPTIDGVKRWGEFSVVMSQAFRYQETEAIVNALKPVSRKLISIRFANAILLNGSQLLNGSTILEGLEGIEDSPAPWFDVATSFIPVSAQSTVPDLLTTNNNNANLTFNPQLQAILNNIYFNDQSLIALTNRVNALNSQIIQIGGGSIAPQLAAINAGLVTLSNSNAALANRIGALTGSVNNLATKANTLEADTATIVTASNARVLDVTVQRKNADLTAIADLAGNAPFPANKVIATSTDNEIILADAPAFGAFVPQVANLEFKQPAGSNAGNYPTADVWAAMPFSVISNDDNFLATVSASRYTLPAGTYFITYNWQGCGCLGFGGRIFNQTAGTVIEQGSPGVTVTGGGNVGDTWAAEGCLLAAFTLTASANIEFQFRAKILHPVGAALTAGQSTTNANEQVYQEVVIIRIAN
jgi:P2-related tail formation protein